MRELVILIAYAFWFGSVIVGFVSADNWKNTSITFALLVSGILVFGLGFIMGLV